MVSILESTIPEGIQENFKISEINAKLRYLTKQPSYDCIAIFLFNCNTTFRFFTQFKRYIVDGIETLLSWLSLKPNY